MNSKKYIIKSIVRHIITLSFNLLFAYIVHRVASTLNNKFSFLCIYIGGAIALFLSYELYKLLKPNKHINNCIPKNNIGATSHIKNE